MEKVRCLVREMYPDPEDLKGLLHNDMFACSNEVSRIPSTRQGVHLLTNFKRTGEGRFFARVLQEAIKRIFFATGNGRNRSLHARIEIEHHFEAVSAESLLWVAGMVKHALECVASGKQKAYSSNPTTESSSASDPTAEMKAADDCDRKCEEIASVVGANCGGKAQDLLTECLAVRQTRSGHRRSDRLWAGGRAGT